MKLCSIRIADYRILHEFSLVFEDTPEKQAYALDLIVGVNGTGKSTLLRLLAAIFQYLERKETAPFSFEVSYQLQGSSGITIFSNLEEDSYKRIEQDLLRVSYGLPGNQPSPQEPIPPRAIEGSELPPLVVAFTTGSEREWELDTVSPSEATDLSNIDSLASRNEQRGLPDPADPQFKERLAEWYLRELPGEPVDETMEEGEILSENRFMFISAEQIPLVILCGMLVDMNNVLSADGPVSTTLWGRLQRAMKASRIRLLRGFSLKFRMNMDVLRREDRDFIRDLMKLARRVVQTGSDYLLVFDLVEIQFIQPKGKASSELIAKLLELEGDGVGLFRRLVQLAKPGGRAEPILRDVDLFLEKELPEPTNLQQPRAQGSVNPPLHLLKWLSDGEQSFLGRLCLISLMSTREALILLDEPEVHFNDYWKRQLVFMLDQALSKQQSHVLMTTHSSITLTDVRNTSIWVLQLSNGYTNHAIWPGLRTLGADPSDIMVSVFGAENATGAQSVEYIERAIKDHTSSSKENTAKIAELKQLLSEVGPGYWRFLIRREIHALESKEER